MSTLVIDDSRMVRLVIGNILKEMGMEVLEAVNGLEGLDRLREHPEIDLVLVDWNMPEMDGLEFIKAVRAQHEYDALRLVMVTTETESSQVMRAFSAGANEYVMKPFTKEILVAKISLLNVFGD
jgi:two-component system chemotaxis response regulator CheY